MISVKSTFVKKSITLSLFTFILFVLETMNTKDQNVGIGTATSQTKLDIKGSFRVGGLNNNLLYNSLSGKFNWRNSFKWANGPQYLMIPSASAEGI